MSDPALPDEQVDRPARGVAQVLEDILRRRASGATVSDEEVLAAHPDLMPELGEKLRALRRVEEAGRQAAGAGTAPDGATLTSADLIDEGGPVAGTPALPVDSFAGYQLLGEIHRGGQGVVYQALQKSTKRKVAIKVMKEGPFASAAERARFEREVQVLGQLQHPNIVAVHDSGSAAGVFFFVMDYIAGQPLDVYMASGQHPIAATLRLFAKICAAVNAAHLRGIIHRDLKPSNIRVDVAGEPHILDFGLAKMSLVGTAEDTTPAMTLTGQFVGSLPWASPEQAEGLPSKIDVRTDVYALGVILYQMLTDRFPYEVVGNMRDVLDRILKAEPTRPSTVRKQINDEVETIVLKCLQKERERRYQSAGELARDIGHYLAGEPIEAKRDSYGYVLRKLLRRYRAPIAVATLFTVVMTVSTIALALMYQSQTHARAQADEARRVAEQQEAEARRLAGSEAAARAAETEQRELAEGRAKETQQVADFQAQMLRDIDVQAMGRGIKQRFRDQVQASLERQYVGQWPNQRPLTPEEVAAQLAEFDERAANTQGVDIARHVLDEYVLQPAAKALETQFADQPLVQAQVRDAIGTTYRAVGLYDPAELHLRTALELRQRAVGEEHELVAASFNNLATVLQVKGDFATAETLYRQALALRRRLLGDEHPDVATSLNNLAWVLKDKGDYAAAEPLLREALELNRRLVGDEHLDVAQSLNSLAALLQTKGDYAAAEPLYREALGLRRKLLGDAHPDVGQCLNDLASLYGDKGDYAGAEPLYHEALELYRKALGDEHPEVAITLNNLAWTMQAKGDYAAAEPLLREALALHRKLLGDAHPNVATILTNLASLLLDKGDYAGAEPLFREALALRRKLLGDRHVDVATSLSSLASLLKAKGDYASAEPLHREALALYRELLGNEHPYVASSLNNVAAVLQSKGDYAGAEPLYREALAIKRKLLGEDHPAVAMSLENLAALLKAKGDYPAAAAAYRESLAIREKKLPAGHLDIAFSRAGLAGVLCKLAQSGGSPPTVTSEPLREAETLLRAAHEAVLANATPPPRLVRKIYDVFIELYDLWQAAEPDQGHDAQAAEWRAKLKEWQASTQPATGG